MNERIFPEERIVSGGVSIMAYRIDCSSCESVGYYPQKRGGIPRPPPAVIEHFRAMKWIVGSVHRKDQCPACAARRKPRKEKTMELTVAATGSQAEPPRVCSREDRRIIMDKLEEVYGKDSYKSPWTDNGVAKDLGVPRDWVSKLREEFFGPAGSNPMFEEYLATCAKIDHGLEAATSAYAVTLKNVEACEKAISELRDEVSKIRMLGKRIEREIGK